MSTSDTPSRNALNKIASDRTLNAWLKRARRGDAEKAMLSDGGGLYVTLTPAGTAVWRIKYRHGGKERLYAVGVYPQVPLEQARAKRDEVRQVLANGNDPVQARRTERLTNEKASEVTFATVATMWLNKQKKDWSEIHFTKSSEALARDVTPTLGKIPVRDITPEMVADMVSVIARRGVVDTAKKILQHVNGIFRLAQAKGYRTDNPAIAAVEVLPRRTRTRRRPALLKFPDLGGVLRATDAASLSPSVRIALRLSAFAPGVRVSNIVEAKWCEFDLDADVPMWIVPRSKMKKKDRDFDHKVVLCDKIADDLREWKRTVGKSEYLFPSPAGGKHITREALEKAYRDTLGLRDKHTPHGWRAAFTTLARDATDEDDKPLFEREVVELALDHIHDTDVARAYDRGERLKQRVRLMRWWGKELTGAQRGAEVIQLGQRA